MKRLVSFLLTIVMCIGLVACTPRSGSDGKDNDKTLKYKIGIVTGTVSQNEEEYYAAEKMKKKYGDMIVTATYPDNFSTETEQTIAVITNMAADKDVKVIVIVQAVPGSTAAIRKVKETRDDILFICGVCAEDPGVISAASDICMLVDEISMGTTIINQAKKMGAKNFVHISFERHLGYATIAARRDLFIQQCQKYGIQYIEATAPDPTGDAGTTGAQAWITENIKVYVDQYGKDTAFFSTNCSMQTPLILECAKSQAIYPQPCCPSPYHGFPSAFNIDVEGHEGDVPYMLGEITKAVAGYGNTGRMSTWEVPINMMFVEAGVEYGKLYCDGKTNGRLDETKLFECLRNIGGEETKISYYKDDTVGELKNFYMVLCPFYDF